VKIYI